MDNTISIFHSVRKPRPTLPQREKRDKTRYARDGIISVFPVIGGRLSSAIPVRLKDVSANGMGFYHTQRMVKGMRFIVGMSGVAGSNLMFILYRVVRCISRDEVKHEVGAIIVATLRQRDLEEGRSFPGVLMDTLGQTLGIQIGPATSCTIAPPASPIAESPKKE